MTEPTKTRPGDQPLPTPGRESVQDALIQLIQERRDLGVQRYGTPLMTHNGRDAGRDALEEALDLTVYLMQARMETADAKTELEAFTEYGYTRVYADGTHGDVDVLSHDRDHALGQYRAIAHSLEDTPWQVAFVSRRVTRTPWADAEQPEADR